MDLTLEINPKQKYTTDRYQRGGLTTIRIRTRDKWSHRRNSLKQLRTWRILHELLWRVIQTERSDPALMRIHLNIVRITEDPMPSWIAEEQFDYVSRRGKRFTLILNGPPVALPSEGKISSFARILLSVQPLFSEKNVGGENTFQALCLAIEHARTVFKVFLSEGGRIYWRDTKKPDRRRKPMVLPAPKYERTNTDPEAQAVQILTLRSSRLLWAPQESSCLNSAA